GRAEEEHGYVGFQQVLYELDEAVDRPAFGIPTCPRADGHEARTEYRIYPVVIIQAKACTPYRHPKLRRRIRICAQRLAKAAHAVHRKSGPAFFGEMDFMRISERRTLPPVRPPDAYLRPRDACKKRRAQQSLPVDHRIVMILPQRLDQPAKKPERR